MRVVAQENFAGGIFRASEGERIPANGAYDIVNGLLDEQGAVYRRGGSAYRTTADVASGNPLVGLASGWTATRQFTFAWTAGEFYGLDGTSLLNLSGGSGVEPFARAANVAGFTVLPRVDYRMLLYAGSQKTTDYTAGTAATTVGSTTVTGTGTAWLANVDPGMILKIVADYYIVESVQSDTSLTVTRAATTAYTTAAYTLSATAYFDPLPHGLRLAKTRVAGAGTPGRLLYSVNNRVYFSDPGTLKFAATNYHELPAQSVILGLDAFRDNCVVFTTQGVWLISNLNLDPVDASGNQQHVVSQVNKELVLWGDSGVEAWAGTLLVPALDDVYLLSLNEPPVRAPEPITGPIRPLYRSYVAAGYRPGRASIFRGHYFLPIVNGTTWVDTLVCRLDGGFAWTRWSGHGGSSTAYGVRDQHATPLLLSANNARVLDLTGTFAPTTANNAEADGTTHEMTIITRSYVAARQIRIFWKKLRARFSADATGGMVRCDYSTEDSAAWTTISTQAADADGDAPTTWPVNQRARSIRFRLVTTTVAARIAVRSLELFHRETGRQ